MGHIIVDAEWVDTINALLPSTVRVIDRLVLPAISAANIFHAEGQCTQRVYEYMLPLSIVMPAELIVVPQEQTVRLKKRSWLPPGSGMNMSDILPMDDELGQGRILYFRNLKRILKLFSSEEKKFFHNFATGGGTPDEAVSKRRVDRAFHKEMVVFDDEVWVVFSFSGDAFMRGQIRRIMGLTIALCRGWLPEEFIEAALSPEYTLRLPAAPGFCLYLAGAE
jgi:tRNA U38,U39,U40 pseudouridine synthase TruA